MSNATRNWLCDMDGVLIAEGSMVEGANRFLDRLRSTGRSFLVLTNNSMFTPRELHDRLSSMGLDVNEEQFWTSALATAQFVRAQRPGGSAFVIGESSLHSALDDVGYRLTRHDADYVVLGETQDYSFEDFATAISLIEKGSHFVATNPEPTGPSPNGSLPGCGAMAAIIERATGVAPYFVGKPNARMIREALDVLSADSRSSVMIGDRMGTDILAGVDAGVETILVLSGVDGEDDVDRFPFRPSRVIRSVAELIDEL
ncbi:MAG TPA: HAD-IIA family hydrolase [Acidimicrobiales bacterium]|nr:HAD-IIA family hydrolase [Acidimicrobiales bacterium]